MTQAPMISCPLKQTHEIDWIAPLKGYIRQNYGDDPERYAEECATLNRLRQDMRGAGKDSAQGRDLLYRYYGQLELLDLRFPVDENHIKISFTWLDAFTQKATSQYSLAYEKASIIFNISAVLSCHAANQTRSEDTGLKTAYHSFQASAGMFTYINENFLHAPSTDLSRETVKTLIAIMLAQAQEVFLEKQVADGKKVGLLAKLANQATYLYTQAAEGAQENVTKGVFDRVWLLLVQTKASHVSSLANYYQALADNESKAYGSAITRLQTAEKQSQNAAVVAKSLPSSMPASSNLGPETASTMTEIIKRQLTTVQEALAGAIKDNDFIYHQAVPPEATLPAISKLPAAKAVPVSELYQGQDIQRIIGPDIFQKIVPLAVTETASLYDEEKAKLVRAETERVETANGEMAASLDYFKLPESLNILKGGMDHDMTVDEEFRQWCESLAGHEPFSKQFQELRGKKEKVKTMLEKSLRNLEYEESVCEKMRSKYGADWTQQPSSRLTATLWSDVRSYRDTIEEAAASDIQLQDTADKYETDFDEMRSAGETDEADVLFQRALIKAGAGKGKGKSDSPYSASAEPNLLDEDYGESGPSVADQIARVEDLVKRLNLVKRERMQILKDLKDKVRDDDISNVLILNKKSIANHEEQFFQAELEKFRPHQNRLLQANHKQSALMKELKQVYGDLLLDKRVQSEQSKYQSISRSRNAVMTKYRKIYQTFRELGTGLHQAQTFYSQMGETVSNLEKNVDAFLNNRKSEGAQLLGQIERNKASGGNQETEKLQNLMDRLAMSPPSPAATPDPSRPDTSRQNSSGYPRPNDPSSIAPSRPPTVPTYPQQQQPYRPGSAAPPNGQHMYPPQTPYTQGAATPLDAGYNPMAYPYPTSTTTSSPPPQQQPPYFSSTPNPYYQQSHAAAAAGQQAQQRHTPQPGTAQPGVQSRPMQQPGYIPPGYIPPPPPPGPPPGSSTTTYPPNPSGQWPSGPGGYANSGRGWDGRPLPQGQQTQPPQPPQQGQAPQDPWAGLSAWR